MRTLGAGAGLIAATRDNVSEPTWLVTGTDAAGVAAAAAALTPARLRDHFALAVQGGTDLPVPVEGGYVSYRRRCSPLHAARAGGRLRLLPRAGGRGADALAIRSRWGR